MLKFFKSFLICFLFSAFILTAATQAATVTSAELEKAVIEQVGKGLEKYELNDYEIKILNMPVKSLTVPDGKITIKTDSPTTKNLTSRSVVRTVVYVNGQYAKSIGIPIEIKAYRYVLTAKYEILRNEAITPNKLDWKKIDVANYTAPFLSEKELQKGVTSLKNFQAGEIINARFTKIKPDVTKNATVKVIFGSGSSLNVSTEGVAMTDGRIGDFINVQSKSYKKMYTGKIIGENEILVKVQ